MQNKDKNLTIKGRFLQFIESQGLKKDYFFKKIGIASSNFKGAGMNSIIGGDILVKILTLCPDINAEWLLTGKGKKLKDSPTGSEELSELEDLKSKLAEKDKIINDLIAQQGRLIDKLIT